MKRMSSIHIVVLLLSIMAITMITSSRHMTRTYDEAGHLEYGLKILHLDSNKVGRYQDSKMPFSLMNAALYSITYKLLSVSGVPAGRDARERISLAAGRSVTMLCALLLGVYVFKWTKDLYGDTAALFSLALYAFSPNIIAHARLITTDLYAALMTTIAMYYFWGFIKYGGRSRALLSAFTLGLSQLTKYTCIYLYPIFLTIVIIKYSHTIFKFVVKKDIGELLRHLILFLKYSLMFLVVSILLINAGFLFNRPFTPLCKYEFKSSQFKKIQLTPILKDIPLLLPYPYLKGLDILKHYNDTGKSFGNVYLFGKIGVAKDKQFDGFKGYYFYAYLLKEPLVIQLFILLSFVMLAVNRKRHNVWKDELFILLPALVNLVYFNYFFRMQIGIRYLLLIFPLGYIFCGIYLRDWKIYSNRIKSMTIVLFVYLIASSISYFPHYLSYFNEIVWDRKQAYKLLADSNIDWGQSEWYLKEYMKKYPYIKVNPASFASGRIVVSVNHLVGVFDPINRYEWLRENFKPVSTIAYSYLVYDVSPKDFEMLVNKGNPA